jgi:hypothetical protein
MDVLGHVQFDAGMPARLVQDEHNLLLGAGADLLGKGGQCDFEEGDADRGRQMKDRAAGSRVDEADQVAPREPRRSDAAPARRAAARRSTRPF